MYKRQINQYIFFSIALTLLVLMTSSCKDIESPTIRFNGPDTLEVVRGTTGAVTIPSAIAFDNQDFDISHHVVSSGTFDKTRVGYYPITYSVADEAGNTGTSQMIVHVIHTPTSLFGSYASSSNFSNCPTSGNTQITNRLNEERIYIERVMGGIGTYRLALDLTKDGELSLVSALFPCSYNASAATGQVSSDGDSVVVNLILKPNGTNSTVPATVWYVRQ
jgi:hypothetical protein